MKYSNLAINMHPFIPIQIIKHVDRIQITILDYGYNILSQLMASFSYKNIRLLHNFYINGNLKFQYIKYPKADNPFSTFIIHDVKDDDQVFLVNLLNSKRYWLRQVEFAWDFYPENKYDLIELYDVISDGLILKYSRVDCYRCVGFTKYWAKNGKAQDGVKGLKFYPKPRAKPFEFVRLELQANKPLIDRLHLKLPIAPDAINPFDYIEYRRDLEMDKLTDILCKREKFHASKYPGHKDLLRVTISGWVDCQIIGKHRLTLCEEYPATASQISNLKAELPELRHRLDHLFPKWAGKKEQLLEDIHRGFVRRSYE
jgi:hypothetical protein